MVQLIKPFGFTGYLELFKHLEAVGLAGEKSVRLEIDRRGPDRKRITEALDLEVEYIKARAFDEILAERREITNKPAQNER